MRRKLRTERLKRKLTIEQVAEEIGISKSHYTNIELGRSDPAWDVGCRIGKFFNTDGCKLLKRDGDDE